MELFELTQKSLKLSGRATKVYTGKNMFGHNASDGQTIPA